MKQFLSQDVYDNFYTPLSLEAAQQLAELATLVQALDVDDQQWDQWSYIWGSTEFCTQKAYKFLKGTLPTSLGFKWIWSSCCRGHRKFFFWLHLRDRLITRKILRRKRGVLDDYSCPLCSSVVEETSHHLFFRCSFRQWCWRIINIRSDIDLEVFQMILQGRRLGRSGHNEIKFLLWRSIVPATMKNDFQR